MAFAPPAARQYCGVRRSKRQLSHMAFAGKQSGVKGQIKMKTIQHADGVTKVSGRSLRARRSLMTVAAGLLASTAMTSVALAQSRPATAGEPA